MTIPLDSPTDKLLYNKNSDPSTRKRVIYSTYINIPDDVIDSEHSDSLINFQTKRTTNSMAKHFDWLKSRQQWYADQVGAEYILFEYDDQYKEFYDRMSQYGLTTYDIINFYKIHLMYEIDCDEILYLDFDVVPLKPNNIFDIEYEGIACRVNHEDDPQTYKEKNDPNYLLALKRQFKEQGKITSIRSPRAKWWNARAMLIDEGFSGENDVYNTGMILAKRDQINKLDYFGTFESDIQTMKDLRDEEAGGYPDYIRSFFGFDNETLFSYKMQMNDVNLHDLDDTWHYLLNKKHSYVVRRANFIHVQNKDFEYVRGWLEKNNL